MSQLHPVQNDQIMLITTNVRHRYPLFAEHAYAREAIDVLYRIQGVHPFSIFAFVIMPDHMHILLSVSAPSSVSKIINRFKMGVSHSIGIGPIWQPRFHMRIVRDPHRVLRYIHENPVAANLVVDAKEYLWSSASNMWDVSDVPW